MEPDFDMEDHAFAALDAMVGSGHAEQASVWERNIRRLNIERIAELEAQRTSCESTLFKCSKLRLKINAALAAQQN